MKLGIIDASETVKKVQRKQESEEVKCKDFRIC